MTHAQVYRFIRDTSNFIDSSVSFLKAHTLKRTYASYLRFISNALCTLVIKRHRMISLDKRQGTDVLRELFQLMILLAYYRGHIESRRRKWEITLHNTLIKAIYSHGMYMLESIFSTFHHLCIFDEINLSYMPTAKVTMSK